MGSGYRKWTAQYPTLSVPSSSTIMILPALGVSHGAQLAKTGYHTRLIHFVQYFMEESVCMVSEGHVEPVDE